MHFGLFLIWLNGTDRISTGRYYCQFHRILVKVSSIMTREFDWLWRCQQIFRDSTLPGLLRGKADTN